MPYDNILKTVAMQFPSMGLGAHFNWRTVVADDVAVKMERFSINGVLEMLEVLFEDPQVCTASLTNLGDVIGYVSGVVANVSSELSFGYQFDNALNVYLQLPNTDKAMELKFDVRK